MRQTHIQQWYMAIKIQESKVIRETTKTHDISINTQWTIKTWHFIFDYNNACYIIMVALWNRADHYIFALWFLSFFLLFFFPRLISAAVDWMSIPCLHTWCGLSANLRCRSETCCTRLAGNAGRKKVAKNRHLGTIAQIVGLYIFATIRHVSTIGKKTC